MSFADDSGPSLAALLAALDAAGLGWLAEQAGGETAPDGPFDRRTRLLALAEALRSALADARATEAGTSALLAEATGGAVDEVRFEPPPERDEQAWTLTAPSLADRDALALDELLAELIDALRREL